MRNTELAQSRPGDTNAVSIYSPPTSTNTTLAAVYICNTTANTQKFRIFLDQDGTTYDETTALFWDVPLASDTTMLLDGDWPMDNSSGNLAVRTDLASAFTFTVFGSEDQI